MSTAHWRQRFRWVLMPVACLALAWAIWLLWGSWPQVRTSLPRVDSRWLWLPLAGTIVGGYLTFEAFRGLFQFLRPGLYRRGQLAHLYFTGQLMKHLPGRIWGVAYQSAAGHQASVAEWISVTMAYMALTTLVALWMSATVLGLLLSAAWGVGLLLLGGVVYAVAWHTKPLGLLLDLVRLVPARPVVRVADAIQPFAAAGMRFKMGVLAWFVVSWLVYLLAWAGFGVAWPGLAPRDGIFLCAIYTIAWFVGYITLVSPSGIGVRELVFVLLSHSFPADAVAGMLVLGRATLLVADIVLAGVFVGYRRLES